MGDLYLNELSIDFRVSKELSNENKAKKLLLQFIQTYLAYRVSTGLERIYILSKERLVIKKIGEVFGVNGFFKLLNELEETSAITDIDKKLFKAAISETFKPDWNQEYFYSDQVAYGLGEACKHNGFSISFSTEILNSTDTWDKGCINIKERKLKHNNQLIEFPKDCRNISTTKHVVESHEIWKKCCFTNKTKSLLPKKGQLEFIVKAVTNYSWVDFYVNQQRLSITEKQKIGSIVARVNGWKKCSAADSRPTFNMKKRYMAVDTRHSEFEIYEGVKSHIGTMKFNDDTIDTSKSDSSRRLILR